MLSSLWHWFVTSRYTQALESEVARLRAENKALMNSILGVAGVPPLKLEASDAAVSFSTLRNDVQPRYGSGQVKSVNGDPSKGRVTGPAPVRRRTWQQIGKFLERQTSASDRIGRDQSGKAGSHTAV
jgi:hypothetical protein